VWERLDDGIAWLESLGAPVVAHETGNPRTIGKRFDPRGLTDVLARAAGDVRLGETTDEPTILATGGFQGNPELVMRHIHPGGVLRLRANPWSAGDGLELALARGAELSAGLDEFYGRNMPDTDFSEEQYVPLAQLYGRVARVLNDQGKEFFEGDVSWSENDLVQATARQPGARAWYRVPDAALEVRVRDRSVGEMVEAAAAAGAPVERRTGEVVVETVAGVTQTLGGLAIDTRAQAAPGVYACGGDVGGIATGGWASGLAAALVFGRIAAESALGVA
jgi:hypothetical protein